MGSSNGRARAKAALRRAFAGSVDGDGYVARVEENLVEGVRPAHFESDLSEGDGGELRKKFPAIRSRPSP